MKKFFLITTLVGFAFANCEYKIQKLQEELEYAKKYNNHNRIKGLENAINNIQYKCSNVNKSQNLDYIELKNQKKEKIKELEKQLDELKNNKKNMSKIEYKNKKKELKNQIKQIKSEYKN